MEVNEKQTRRLKVTTQHAQRKRNLLQLAIIIMLTAILVIFFARLLVPSKVARSKDLTRKVTNLMNNSYCKDGLKQISPMATTLRASEQYTNAAREQALTYLMSCNATEGNVMQALVYGNQLSALYSQDHNTVKQRETTQYMLNIKNFGH